MATDGDDSKGKETAAEAISRATGLEKETLECMSAISRLNTYCSFYIRGGTNERDGISADDSDECKTMLDDLMGGYDPRTMSGGEYQSMIQTSMSCGTNTIGGGYRVAEYCPGLFYNDGKFSVEPITYEWITSTLASKCDSTVNTTGYKDRYFIEDDNENTRIAIIGTLLSILIFDKQDSFSDSIDKDSVSSLASVKQTFNDMLYYYAYNFIRHVLGDESEPLDDEVQDGVYSYNTGEDLYGKVKKQLEDHWVFSNVIETIKYLYALPTNASDESCKISEFIGEEKICFNHEHASCISKFGRYIRGCSFISDEDIKIYNDMNDEYEEYQCKIWDVLCDMNAVNICMNVIDGQMVINDDSNITIDQTMECVQLIDGQTDGGTNDDEDDDSDDDLRPNRNDDDKPNNNDNDDDSSNDEASDSDGEMDSSVKTLMTVIIILGVIIVVGMIGLMIVLATSNKSSNDDEDDDDELTGGWLSHSAQHALRSHHSH